MRNLTILFAVVALMTCFLSQAQTEQGELIVGGELGFTSASTDGEDGSFNTIMISPSAAYFIIDNLAGGLALNFINSKDSEADDGSSVFGIGPFVRYYLDVGVFGELAFDYVSQTILDNDAVTGSWFTPRIGYAAFLNNHVAVEPSVYYAIGGGDLYEDNSIFGLSVAFNIYLNQNGN